MNLFRLLSAITLFLAVPGFVSAQEKLPDGAKVAKLDVRPAKVELTGPFAYSQLLVTATLDTGETVDVTRIAKIGTRPGVAVTAGLVRPTADASGRHRGVARRQDREGAGRRRPASRADKPVSFVTDVQPVLSKLGCNAGTCHGAQAGKNGFKLSLRGYDPIYDFRALTDDLEGRRFNRAAPEKSLMLLKPAGAVPHQGGVIDAARRPELRTRSAVDFPGRQARPRRPAREVARNLPEGSDRRAGSAQKQQFAVIATYTDGRVRDVTAEAFIDIEQHRSRDRR